ncbi:MAG: hypothetical protein O2931_14685 [Planctomycetota bacterium]|nr:hypothetical protein [Planctomycetota bacterium]
MSKSVLLTVSFTFLAIAVSLGVRESQPKSRANATNSTSDGKLIVHEWGTFTTFSGSDGVFLDFRPLAASQSDLPDYVLDRLEFSKNIANLRAFSKGRLRARVRMETPVTYFYSDRIRTVDVSVDFPEGLLTEYYPPVREVLPAIDETAILGKGELIGKSSLNWGSVDIIPVSELVPNVSDATLNQTLSSGIVHALVPHAANEQHYASARETDSAIVHVRNNEAGKSYFEKFLFYRGVGKFPLPMKVRFVNGKPIVSNDGSLSIASCILINIDGDLMQAAKLDRVERGQLLPFDELKSVTQEQLAAMVRQSLLAEGLYEKEAASMVETWKQSWFTEQGTRVLYMLPGPTTNELLPLKITPQPQAVLRVLVGRMEVMSPTTEQAILKAVAESAAARLAHDSEQHKLETHSPYPVPETISRFGRLAEPALARIMSLTSEANLRREAEALINQIQSM